MSKIPKRMDSPFINNAHAYLEVDQNDDVITLIYRCEITRKKFTTKELDELNLTLLEEQTK